MTQLLNIADEICAIKTDWRKHLLNISKQNEIKSKLQETEIFINEKKKLFKNVIGIFPPNNLIFNTFNFFNLSDTKVVIIGQDPYHQAGQAMGLSFSVPENVKIPPSLVNIFKEIESDKLLENNNGDNEKNNDGDNEKNNNLENVDNKKSKDNNNKTGDLTRWAQQGVLLLNANLTVQQNKANSHKNKWDFFTDAIISYISKNNEGIVFMLWGNFAKNKNKLIDSEKHLILKANHPSPLSANRGGWFGCQHFSTANQYLKEQDKKEITW